MDTCKISIASLVCPVLVEGRLHYIDNPVGMNQMVSAAKLTNADVTYDEVVVQVCQALAARVNKNNSCLSSYWLTVARIYSRYVRQNFFDIQRVYIGGIR